MSDEKAFVERIFRRYANAALLPTDPVGLVHEFTDPRDRETAALLCALFAYGGVKAMRSFLSSLLVAISGDGVGPAAGLQNLKLARQTELYYRFQSSEDIQVFLTAVSRLMSPSVGPVWETRFGAPDQPMDIRIDAFQRALLEEIPRSKRSAGIVHLTGRGHGTGARKRFCMYLRWMVRSHFPDLGIYKTFRTRDLVVPLDVHMLRLARTMGWTQRKSADWKTAQEVTAALRRLDPEDPLRYDFPLTRIGILRERKILSDSDRSF